MESPAALCLPRTVRAFGTPDFAAAFAAEVEDLDPRQLPLQQALSGTSYLAENPHRAMLIGATERAGTIRVRAGIFFSGILAGCSCADDPAPVEAQNEYCELQFDIDRASAAAVVTLLSD